MARGKNMSTPTILPYIWSEPFSWLDESPLVYVVVATYKPSGVYIYVFWASMVWLVPDNSIVKSDNSDNSDNYEKPPPLL